MFVTKFGQGNTWVYMWRCGPESVFGVPSSSGTASKDLIYMSLGRVFEMH